jgi:CRP/FNR family transcriptional regulator
MPSKELKPSIRDLPLFSELSVEELRQLMRRSAVRSYKRGDIIFTEGDPYAGLYIVLSGHVKVFKTNREGKEQILHIFGAREPFADVPLFIGGAYPASAQALEESRLLFIARQAFLDLLQGNTELCLCMLGAFARRLRQMVDLVDAIALKEVTLRLARYLFDETRNTSGAVVRLPISKANLAALLGTIPETLSRSLRQLEEDGIITVQGKEILISDKRHLQQLAG